MVRRKKIPIILSIIFLLITLTIYFFIPIFLNNLGFGWNINTIFKGYYTGDKFPNESINIAILDTPIANSSTFPKFSWIYDARNGTDLNNNTFHGTIVMSALASYRNFWGLRGINPNANYYSIIVEDGTGVSYSDAIAPGIYAAVNGPDGIPNTRDDANIIVMSFSTVFNHSDIYKAVKYAYDHNVVMVASSGDISNSFIRYLANNTIVYPAAYPEVIGVGATCQNNSVADFSNSGSFVEMVAPGYNVYTANGEFDATLSSGTSISAPEVAGVVSLILAKYGNLPVGNFFDTTLTSIRGYLHSMAIDLGSPGLDPVYGYGLVQFY